MISKYLLKLKKELNVNIRRNNLSLLLKQNIKKLENLYKIQIDYLELRNEKNLKTFNKRSKYRLFIAYYVEKVRLIDNYQL